MQAALALLLLLAGACAARGAARAPLAVLYEDEPWSLGDVASRSPVFALYDDGLVIYLARPGDPRPTYASVILDEGERARLLALLPSAIDDLEASYDLFDMPHHPFNVLHVWRAGKRKTVTVYGDLGEASDVRDQCPAPFLAAYDALRHYRHERATGWHPETLRLDFSEQALADAPRKPWPAGWPDLTHPDTRRVSDGYVLRLGVEHLDELVTFWEHPGNSHAVVEIGGRTGYLSYAYPFPCEERWAGNG